MSKPFTEEDLSNIFDIDLIWRRKELSDLKTTVKAADDFSRPVLLKAIVALSYSHWEGYVRTCATKYFEHLTVRRKPYLDFERQIYINSFLIRLDALYKTRIGLNERCKLVTDILDGSNSRFSYINPDLIDTKSNLNTDVVCDICTICGIDSSYFQNKKTFIDVILLKRRNAIAHGQQENIQLNDLDEFVSEVLSLMSYFRNLLENKAYTKAYLA
ncbi:MAE_28990/MAE_18760 family HEPN-like nuclease [Methylomonas koyamae]|uniref:MAE_28990/MAE_18760 family HEPN-like nuclease n=1 Tax=Methylomonas koyamae TaxID=702114 RepID=UPI002872F01C|nr:MAE_28990/MAE_18760 family HEPN-like nuclease [Methylomonas koyamae]WNB74477.1 MAE_28990/MAE_18760 family HEPN-like nuclease [Methylomonas koyamae]